MENKKREQLKYKILIITGTVALAVAFAFNLYTANKLLATPSTISQQSMTKVYQVENSIRENDYETFYAYDTSGNLLAEVKGDHSRVDVSAETVAEIAKHKNTVLTHNHPTQHDGQTYPLSIGDLIAASTINAKTMRAIGTTADYEITRNTDKWASVEEITQKYNTFYQESINELEPKYENKEISWEEYSIQKYHITLEKLAKEFNLTYSKIDRQ